MKGNPTRGTDEQAADEPVVPSETKANLGCGDDYREKYHNVDINPGFEVDQLIDLEESPWPLPDNHFDEALVDNVLEHIDPRRRPAFLKEAHRVLAPRGELIVRLPTQVGWDVTHYAVPSHRWPHHPDNADDWELLNITAQKVGPGRLMPTRLALLCTEYNVIRCLSQVEVRVRSISKGER